MSEISNSDVLNFKEFKSAIGRYGFSLSNFYDVQFLVGNTGNNFLESIFTRGRTVNIQSTNSVSTMMRLFADECTIPGYGIATGDFRINNTPNMKYAYGIVNNEITMSFISDADSEIRKTFDAWGNYIYSGITSNASRGNGLNTNGIIDIGRTRYKDDYVLDIAIIKLERYQSSKKNSRSAILDPVTRQLKVSKTVPLSTIFPNTDTKDLNRSESEFGQAFQVYSVRLKNAFPTTISAIPLSSGSSQLIKIQVTFEYDLAAPASQTGDTISAGGNWKTIVN